MTRQHVRLLKRALLSVVCCLSAYSQNTLSTSPSVPIVFRGVVDNPVSSFTVAFGKGAQDPGGVATIGVSGGSPTASSIPFKFDRVVNTGPLDFPNFTVVTPATGLTPAFVTLTLNEPIVHTLAPGVYDWKVFFSTVDQSPPAESFVYVELQLAPPPAPSIKSIVNAASFSSSIAPGEIVTIFGAHLGQPSESATFDETGVFPKTLAGTTVTLNGIPAPLLYVSSGQINAVVPYATAGGQTASVVVTRTLDTLTQSSPPFVIFTTDTAPAIFTTTQDGKGQGAILNFTVDQFGVGSYTYNSAENPAAAGSVVTLFATGSGEWDPPIEDGAIHLSTARKPLKQVSLSIAGRPADLLYAGGAPYLINGVLQMNAVVPAGAPSGPQPIVLTIGDYDNSGQPVTIAIK